jgi:hypothetical protein
MKRLSLIILFLAILLNPLFAQVEFTASTSRVVAMGEQFALTYQVNAAPQGFTAPTFTDFSAQGPSQGSSSSVEIINGKVSQSVTYTYTYYLSAKREGKFTIPPATVKVGGKSYQSNSVTIEVVKGNASANKQSAQRNGQQSSNANLNDKDLYLRVNVDKSEVYQGEQVIAIVKIYTRAQIQGLNNYKPPTFNGFWTQEINTSNNVQLERENVNGQIYNTATIKEMILFPQKSGDLTIDPSELTVSILQRVQPKSWFDPGWQEAEKVIKSNSVKIRVKPLPANQPADFKGAVGNFTMTANIDRTKGKSNEPLTIKVNLTGSGNIKLIDPFQLQLPPDFEAYDPKVSVDVSNTRAGSVGKKTIDYLVIPRHPGNFTIPAITFSYFDPKSQSYKTLKSQDFNVEIEKGADGGSAQVVTNINKEDVKVLGSDIRFIENNPFSLSRRGELFSGSGLFYALYVILLVVFGGLFVLLRKQIRENANHLLVRNKKAAKVSQKRLKVAAQYLKSNNKEMFYNEVLKALWGYLGDKLSIPVSELKRDTVVETLNSHNIDSQLTGKFIEMLDICEFARYAPATEAGQMQKVYDDASDVINNLAQKLK